MLEKIKMSLRISNSEFDNEIQDLINACGLDLAMSGVSKDLIQKQDSLIIQATQTYCKANFGFDNPEAERFREAYASLKNFLAIVYRE